MADLLRLTDDRRTDPRTGEVLAALLLMQPLLDVLSFAMAKLDATVITTLLRLVLLLAVTGYGFLLSRRKLMYAGVIELAGLFWLLHMINCLRQGYEDPVGDAAEFLKILQLPLWTMAFVSMFRSRDGLAEDAFGVLPVNLLIILFVICLSMIFYPVYTYDYPERGVQIGLLGWFAVPSAQSAVLCLLAPGVLLCGLRSENLPLFSLSALLSLGMLFATGTRLCYYTALLLAAVFLVLILITRRPLPLVIPLAVLFVLLLALRGVSPMEQRQELSQTSYDAYQEKIDAIMADAPDEDSPQRREALTRVYEEIYGQEGLYGETLLGDLLTAFGTDRVMEALDYSADAHVLNNMRTRRLTALSLQWEEKDFLTHLLGMEHAAATLGENTYDPENDFPALVFYIGWLGTALYCGFLLWVLGVGFVAFLRRMPALLTAEFAAPVLMFVLALGAAQFSGNVLRRPSVLVYFAFAAAEIIFQAETARGGRGRLLRGSYHRNPAVTMKKI